MATVDSRCNNDRQYNDNLVTSCSQGLYINKHEYIGT